MLAVRYYGPKDIRTEEIPIPIPQKNDALIKVLYAGICGSDLHIYREGMFMTYAPETLGHEFVGRIETAPAGSKFQKGDIVTAHPGVYCGKCASCLNGDFLHCLGISFIGECRQGCFADYIALDQSILIKFDGKVDLAQAGVTEPLAVALHAVKRIDCKPNDHAAVFGAGPIGLLIAYLLKYVCRAASVSVIDIDPYRREQAEKCGADEILADYKESRRSSFQKTIDCAGAEIVFNTALNATEPDGTLFVTALYEKLPVVDVNLLVNKELNISGNNAYTFADMEEAAALTSGGKYDFSWLITSIVPAQDAPAAFRSLAGKDRKDIKILLDFTD
jgi:2-desacetyl-2-hydroxyethyl bacteriochlorophyllide A dehydrogenase